MRFRLRTLTAQFSLRDLLWLVAVAAMASAWLREWSAMTQMKDELAAARAADAGALAEQQAALTRKRQEIERELALIRRRLRDADARVQAYSDDNAQMREIMSRPGYPYDAGRGTYFLAPVR